MGNIPYLVPGDAFCSPCEPDHEFPLLEWILVLGSANIEVTVQGAPGHASGSSDPAPHEPPGEEEPSGEMSEEARPQIVPPPKPHKETILRKAATEVRASYFTDLSIRIAGYAMKPSLGKLPNVRG